MQKNKTAFPIALFLMATIAITLIAIPAANAHDPPWNVDTWCFVVPSNNPIGVNQELVIVFWSSAIPPTAVGAFGDRWTFYVDITLPDGSKDIMGPYKSDPIGGGWLTYTPTQTGTYTLTSRVNEEKVTGLPIPPGQTINTIRGAAYVNDTYLASTSDPVELVVQEEPIQPWPGTPLPTHYWTRPINTINRDWWQLAGNWLSGVAQTNGPTSNFAYGTGPESAHILWSTPMWAGGIMDARIGEEGYQTAHYEGMGFLPPIILQGKIYYNVQSLPRIGWYCLDLYTGETEYFFNTTGDVSAPNPSSSGNINDQSLSFGQVLKFDCPNQHGGFPYLWSTVTDERNKWNMYDAFTGNYICSIKNVPSLAGTTGGMGTINAGGIYGKDGSILQYLISGTGANKRLLCWNTTQAIWWHGTQQQYQTGDYSGFGTGNAYWMWRPGLNEIYDGDHGYSLNVSIPDVQGNFFAVREDQFAIGGTSGKHNSTTTIKGTMWCLSLEKGKEGTRLWERDFVPPETVVTDTAAGGLRYGIGTMQGPIVSPEDGVFVFSEAMTRRYWGYSLDTMQLLWGPTEPGPQMNFYGVSTNIYEGKVLSHGYGGVILAYDIQTGELLWNYTASQIGYESPYGYYPCGIAVVADGKLYLTSSEHSPTQPLWRGSYLRCINASDGVELWKIQFWGAKMSPTESDVFIADGLIVGLNYYDMQIYCLGKGPSTTTVTASPEISTHGENVLIKGIVSDQSYGARKLASDMGVNDAIIPAISDEDQGAWMEYLYMQQAMPKDITGVAVKLETFDPNGNFYEIGRTTSDASGLFSYVFAPEVPGKYTIIATFEGSNSYYGSYGETALSVDEAPQTTPTPTPPPPSMADIYLMPATIGIIVAIVVATIVIVLMLRKR
jgi:hypothetical protein